MQTTNHQEILNQIGQSLGLELEFDENGQCFLLLDEKLMVSIRSLDDSWILYGMLGNIDEDEQEEVAFFLLSLNLSQAESGGASIAVEKSSGVLMQVLRVPTAGMDGERMQEIIGHFVDQLAHTIATLNGEQALPVQASALAAFPNVLNGFFERA